MYVVLSSGDQTAATGSCEGRPGPAGLDDRISDRDVGPRLLQILGEIKIAR